MTPNKVAFVKTFSRDQKMLAEVCKIQCILCNNHYLRLPPKYKGFP